MPQVIGVPRETAAGERRVATVPGVVEKVIKMGVKGAIESGGGEAGELNADAVSAAGGADWGGRGGASR